MESVPAIRMYQKGLGVEGDDEVTLYVGVMTLGQLRKHAKVDMWSPSNPDGYQRPLVDRRLRELARYVQEEQGVLPMSVLVGTRPDDEPTVQPVGFSDNGHQSSSGQLQLPDGAVLWVIDGQHRLYGVNYAYERGAEQLQDYSFPVCVLSDIERFAEMVHFNIINTRQRKMSTDIVDRHLVQIQNAAGIKMVASGARGERDFLRATATKIVDRLNDAPGVWQNQISVPGVPGREQGLVRQHAMVVSIEPLLKDTWVKGASEDERLKVIVNFWDALKEVWPDAFDSPKEHRIQATVGIYSLHMVLPVIVQRCLEDRDLSKDRMREIIEGMQLEEDFWDKEEGHPLTLGTGMASIRALAQYLTERLPQRSQANVKI